MITEEANKRFMTDAERTKLSGIKGGIACGGRIASNGNIIFSTGVRSVSRTAKGVYRITHDLGTVNYGFIGTGYSTNNSCPTMIGMQTAGTSYCDVSSYYGSSGLQDSDFSFIIFSA